MPGLLKRFVKEEDGAASMGHVFITASIATAAATVLSGMGQALIQLFAN